MDRILEPELMDDPDQALAYAKADFEKENQGFVDLFRAYYPDFSKGHILDLGCGPADITIRLARALPSCRLMGVDGSASMIQLGEEAVRAAGLTGRIAFQCVRVQKFTLDEPADAGVSNSLLHHMANPLQFWYGLKRWVKPGAVILVMDLLRPETPEAAEAIVNQYAADESPILRRDFYNSLCAAFTEDEVAGQLAELNLTRLLIDVIDDRHWVVGGTI